MENFDASRPTAFLPFLEDIQITFNMQMINGGTDFRLLANGVQREN